MPGDLSADLSLSAGLTEIGNSVRTTSGDFETKSRLTDSLFCSDVTEERRIQISPATWSVRLFFTAALI
jgi:hypothetical protein